MFRKMLLFLVALLLGLGSTYFLYLQLFVATKIYMAFLVGAGSGLTVAILLLWEDFFAPLFRRSERS